MIYAEDVNYWKTSKSSPDTWLEWATREIEEAGGIILGEGFMREAHLSHSAFILVFDLDGDQFKLLWPCLESKTGNDKASRIQAATALYHEVKSACVKLKFLGARAAFLSYLMLPDGQTASQASSIELQETLPRLLGGHPQLLLKNDEPV